MQPNIETMQVYWLVTVISDLYSQAQCLWLSASLYLSVRRTYYR